MAKICAFGPMLFCINIDSPNEILRSNDGGHSWRIAVKEHWDFFDLYVCGGEILAITGKGFYYSKNGTAWSPRSCSIRGEFYDMVILGDRIIALTTDMDTIYSQDNGRTWSKR